MDVQVQTTGSIKR